MTMLEAFVKERNEALFSLDRKKIEAYMIKYGETEIAQTPDVVFWAPVYKAICSIKDAPEAIVNAVEVQKRSSGCDVCRSVICRTCAARSCAIADGHPFPE